MNSLRPCALAPLRFALEISLKNQNCATSKLVHRRFQKLKGVTFERVLDEAVARTGIRLLSYCVMRNHWHLVVWPEVDGQLSKFVGWLTLTHTQRWHAHRQSAGLGHLYQGRFKSFPIQNDEHFLTVCRYVERNPLRANLVRHAEEWRWSSLYRWHRGTAEQKSLLARWPVRERKRGRGRKRGRSSFLILSGPSPRA